MAEKTSLEILQDVRALHLGYMKATWTDCVKLAEDSISHKSDDPFDEDARRNVVFELAHIFFYAHTLGFGEFNELLRTPQQKRRQSE